MRRLALALALAIAVPALAADGASVARAVRQAQDAAGNASFRARLTITSGGQSKTREFESRIRRDGAATRTWSRVTAPASLAGMAVVSIDSAAATERLLYLPQAGTVTKMGEKGRMKGFLGSDFTFEDVELGFLDSADHTLVSETAAGWILDSVPRGSSSYARLRSTIDRSDSVPRRVEFFDASGRQLKALTVHQVASAGAARFPARLEMVSASGSRSVMEILDWKVGLPASELPDSLFTAEGMKR